MMLRHLWAFLKWLVIILLLLALCAYLFLTFSPTFGGQPDAQSQKRIVDSSHFNGEIFKNLIPTKMDTSSDKSPSMASVLYRLVSPEANKNPTAALQTIALNLKNQPLQNGQLVWLGHSSVLFRSDDLTIMTDPVFNRASPIPLGGKAFAMTNTPTIDDMPKIDVVIISHDHYDHLDHHAIQDLNDKVGHFYVPLGVKAHLQRWGVPNEKITEMDWYDEVQLKNIRLIFTPSRHFSGRTFERNTTLWGSWVVKSPNLSLYFSGDGGYSPEFAKIGQQFGPFDIALVEDGAYNQDWAQIHMFPEQSVQAAVDLNAKAMLPIHWGKFDLSLHQWRDPIERVQKAIAKTSVTLTTPMIGEVFSIQALPQHEWWKSPYATDHQTTAKNTSKSTTKTTATP